MTTKNFNVKNGLTVGTAVIDAATGNIAAGNITGGNLVTANYFSGNAANLFGIPGANVTGTVAAATIAGSVTNATQSNITTVGTLINLTVTGNVAAGNVLTNNLLYANGVAWDLQEPAGSNTQVQFNNNNDFGASSDFTFNNTSKVLTVSGNILGSNIYANTGTIGAASLTGSLTTASQPNVTSLGTLTTLNVSGIITGANITANTGVFTGNGSSLTALNASNVSTGTLAQARLANASLTLGSTSLTLGSTVTTVAGLVSVTSATFVGDLTGNISGSAATVTTNAQPNITSVGTLTGLTVSGNLSTANLVVTATVGGNLIPTANITYDLGNATNRWKDLYLAASTIYLGADSTISAGNLTNGTSNIKITLDGNVSTSVAGNSNIIVATGTGVNVAGYLTATGNISGSNLSASANLSVTANANIGNIGTAGIVIATGNITGGNFITAGFANVGTNANIGNTLSVIGNANVGNLGTAGVIIATGNITGGNANLGNLATANYLSATGGSIAIGDGSIALAAGNAGIFTVGVYNINFGLNSNITMGSNTGNVIARGNMSTNTISVNSIQSKRITIAVGMNTVIDSFPKVDYRSVKYCIRIGSDSGYQAVEVLLVHNGLNSIITVYGSLSTSGSDLLVLSTSINGANVELIGNPVAGETNTTVNLVGIYIQD